jgi:DNA polymerase
MPLLWNEAPADLKTTWAYCLDDVSTEEALSEDIPELHPTEFRVWKLDSKINLRGVRIDRKMAVKALEIHAQVVTALNAELKRITGIPAATQRAKIRTWLSEHQNVDIPDTKGDTLDSVLAEEGLPKKARKILKIVRAVNRSSIAKYKSMLLRMSDKDDRIRDTLAYHGAHTGRFSGKGLQPQNFPRGDIKDMDGAARMIRKGDLDWIEFFYDDVTQFLSFALRGAIIPSKGKEFLVADFAAIEARVVFWLADAKKALKVFERGEDIYCDMAGTIYQRPITKADVPERFNGKSIILGCGFGVGFAKFLVTMRKNKAPPMAKKQIKRLVPNYSEIKEWMLKEGKRQVSKMKDLSFRDDLPELILTKYLVTLYREKYPEIPQLWKDQEQAAMSAVRSPGREVRSGKVTWVLKGRFLRCRLPSGRCLSYFKPKISLKETDWGKKETLSYMGVDSVTRKWVRTFTYGGSIVENVTSAIARDLMAWAMLRLDAEEIYDLILSVHDELIAEIEPGASDAQTFARIMSEVPAWGKGIPVSAEAFSCKRYRK